MASLFFDFLCSLLKGKESVQDTVETYDSLSAKSEVIQNEILETESELKAAQDRAKSAKKEASEKEMDGEDEDLDAYMDKLKKGTSYVLKNKTLWTFLAGLALLGLKNC